MIHQVVCAQLMLSAFHNHGHIAHIDNTQTNHRLAARECMDVDKAATFYSYNDYYFNERRAKIYK